MTEDASADEIPFTPVPLQRKRRTGWTPDRQRAFIAALSRCGSVAAAARQVGMSARGAYALLDKDGADSFTAAWDQAVVMGVEAVRESVIDRAMHGGWVPVVRRGRVVRMEFRHFDRLAIGVLSGRGRDAHELQQARAYDREYRRAQRAVARERAAHEALCARELAEAKARMPEIIAAERAKRLRIRAL